MGLHSAVSTILVVDDDRSIRHVLNHALSADGFQVVLAATVAECVAKLTETSPALVLLDLNLPDGSGIDVLRKVREANDRLPIVLITAEGDSDTAISASRNGAHDYLVKPLDIRRLSEVVHRALKSSTSTRSEKEIIPLACADDFVGRSREMQTVFKCIGQVAKQPVSVLILGESGTGKELVARAIWRHSDRAAETFTAVNCAALSNELLESELFGHEKGAFSGADQRHVGKFEACQHGTLFLDEVGDMHAAMQAKLLRVLQERTFTRVGGDEPVRTDARIISATNRDLKAMCGQNTFREDLLYRLNGFSVFVPPLRDRGADVRLLLAHFLNRFNQKLNKRIEAITADAAELLMRYSWPGNVRELESLLGQIMLNARGGVIEPTDLPPCVALPRESLRPKNCLPALSNDGELKPTGVGEFESLVATLIQSTSNDVYAEAINCAERFLLGRMLEQTDGNQSAAARRLGITRGSLRFKIKQLGISIDSAVKVPSRN